MARLEAEQQAKLLKQELRAVDSHEQRWRIGSGRLRIQDRRGSLIAIGVGTFGMTVGAALAFAFGWR
ncbi:MAG: hypothetical protein ACKVVT_17230 [Dehalococcoidia bacterium]